MADGSQIKERPLITEGQLRAARSLPDNSAPNWKAANWQIPAEEYVGEAHHQLEQEKIFRKMPVPMGPSIQLEKNAYLCNSSYNVPVLLTRDANGVAHAFLNGCRHRGAKLTENEDPKKGKLMVCPYHAWSYALDGKLVGVPREETFSDLDKSTLGLRKLHCQEVGGIIWVILDPNAENDFSHLNTEIREDLSAIDLAGMHLFNKSIHEVDCNWKLIMDTFLEGYHVVRLHQTTLGAMFEDTTTTVDKLGPHIRQTSGRLNFTRDLVDTHGGSFKDIRKVITYVYNLFPCAVLINSPDYVNLLLLIPQASNKTRVENYMLTNTAPDTEKLRNKWERSLALTDGLAFPEDFIAGRWAHEGLVAGVNTHVILGGMEEPVHLFHESVESYLK